LPARIEREELIVDEIAVIGRVGRGVEDRVDAAHVAGEEDLEHLPGRTRRAGGDERRGRARERAIVLASGRLPSGLMPPIQFGF